MKELTEEEYYKLYQLGQWPKEVKKLSWDGYIAYDELAITLPDSQHDDLVDACALAFKSLTIRKPWWVRLKYWFIRLFKID